MVSFTHEDQGTSEEAWAASGLASLPELPLDAGDLADGAVIVLAAHPDDESLGAGGLIARLHGAGVPVSVLLCTAGEASHPGSPTTTPDRLAARRLLEFGAALTRLAPGAPWQYLQLPDGRLAAHREQIRSALSVAAAGSGHNGGPVIVMAPYRHDGHTDHDTVGSVAAEVCAAQGHGLLEYPIWYWLWAGPEDPAWQSWQRVALAPAEQRAKAEAMAAHASQTQPLSGLPGDEVLLPEAFRAHFERSWETFAWQRPATQPALRPAAQPEASSAETGGHAGTGRIPAAYAAADAEAVFDAVHGRDEDPWQYNTSWYEERKRALTLAALPRPHYGSGLEIGCSIGTLSLDLARRSSGFLAVDASSTAVERAAARLAQVPGAAARHLTVPSHWPEGTYDLVVVSEIGYYLSPAELSELLDRIRGAMEPGGTLLLCHWRHPIAGWELDGDAVHAAARQHLDWPAAGMYRERDFIVEVFTAPEPGR